MPAGLLSLTGCNKSAPTADQPAAAPPAVSDATIAAGKLVFTANCAGCHSIAGTGGRRGPDLSHAASEADHTADWIAAYIKNPKSKDPSSRMPAFDGRLADTDVQSVAGYLSTLK